MANYAAIELHPWTSRLPDVDEPTWALIDIDPGTKTSFEEVLLLARLYQSGLEHLGVTGMPKLTGKRGIHIWIPISGGYSFDDTRNWVERLSRAVGATVPDLVSWTWQKNARQGLARLDYTQNALNKTLVAPYSVRAAPGAPVSVPVEWDELDDPELRSDSFTIRTVPERIARTGDPYGRLIALDQRLPDL
jgi:bifunctional non-homologous end joining protein LigD